MGRLLFDTDSRSGILYFVILGTEILLFIKETLVLVYVRI